MMRLWSAWPWFEAWPGTPAEVVRAVVEKFEEHDWEPQGAVRWLSNTEAGDTKGRSCSTPVG